MDASPLVDAVRHALADGSGAEPFRTPLDAVIRRFRADVGMIHRLNPADRHLELVATSDGVPQPVLAAARRIPLGKGIAGETALTGGPARERPGVSERGLLRLGQRPATAMGASGSGTAKRSGSAPGREASH